jgi:transposase-like protein
VDFSHAHFHSTILTFLDFSHSSSAMKQFTPEQKHEILLEYRRYSRTHSFAALAARHGVHGGRQIIQKWFNHWDGTLASLQHKPGAGRPRILTPEAVEQHITAPIRELNRAARQAKYTKIADEVRATTGKNVSDRTINRIGKDELHGRRTRGRKRTAEECNLTIT